ncbi:MAG: DUF1405 domain-containing protein [Tepidanaerobacter acetatoxydans]|uniref:DUF1405 domain-containing protein n=1 Tax=Tepidanaerobacter TaxID=499228 RepID=UPI0025E3969B|nr:MULTISPECIES: DUF1405 domain-containing protein [Tepidanaerobacter]NLU09964.1 DUF1405 domain-containing protein [Tepidanaerobacter acetatoxydans]
MHKKDIKLSLLLILFCINFIGSVYGFYWYRQQLSTTPTLLKVFVPDSPTASLLFSMALLLIIIKKPRPFVTLIACAWLIKYGLWAVIINTHFLLIGGNYTFTNFHLTLSHLGMAIEGFLFINKCHFNKKDIIVLTFLMIVSDAIDYGLGIHPWLFAQGQLKIAAISAVLLTIFISLYCFLKHETPIAK